MLKINHKFHPSVESMILSVEEKLGLLVDEKQKDFLQLSFLKKMIRLTSSLISFQMLMKKLEIWNQNLMMIQKVLLQMNDIHIYLL